MANVPSSGFEAKCLVNDEDAADHDDKLGIATVHVDSIQPGWSGIKEQEYKVKKRKASKRVFMMRKLAEVIHPHQENEAYLVVSVELLGRTHSTQGDDGAHIYTAGPNYWFKHFSPLIAGTKDELHDGEKAITRYKYVQPVINTLLRYSRCLKYYCSHLTSFFG